MEINQIKSAPRRDAETMRTAIFTAVLSTIILALLSTCDLLQPLHNHLGMRLDFLVREHLHLAPQVNERLKVISLDDSTYAYLRKPFLTGEDWAHLLSTIGRARPRAIATTHMFGTGEFSSENDPLSMTIRDLKEKGISLVTGAFAVPRPFNYRTPLEFTDQSLRPTLKTITKKIPGWHWYGPDSVHAHKFSAIGHLMFEDGERYTTRFETSNLVALPHIGIAVASLLGISGPKFADSNAKAILDFPPALHLYRSAKSMKSLLGQGAEAWVEGNISNEDIVLILTEMYTGKARFVTTPVGSIPSGLIVATAISNLLSREGVNDRTNHSSLVIVAISAGIFIGLIPNLTSFTIATVIGSALIAATGTLSFAILGIMVPWVAAGLFFVGPALVVFLRRSHVRLAKARLQNLQDEREREKLSAIVQTTQMFAHDVRKPFTMLNMAGQSLRKISSPDQIHAYIERLIPELERSMQAVEGMIQDIFEIDAKGSLNKEETVVTEFLVECLKDGFLLRNARDVGIHFSFGHTMEIQIDRQKVKRVIANILDNALQAMHDTGRVWIKTVDLEKGGSSFVEITVGNSGSSIDASHLARIFEAFFTQGKRGGTGLGLAIAQKIIHQHGGTIGAASGGTGSIPEKQWTEFTFTLPAAFSTPAVYPSKPLPAVSGALMVDVSSLSLVSNSIDLSDAKGKSAWRNVIVVIDDDVFTLEAWQNLIDTAEVEAFESPTAFWNFLARNKAFINDIVAIVTDYYFDNEESETGETFARRMKEIADIPIILASNGSFDRTSGVFDAVISKDPGRLLPALAKVEERRKAG